MPLDLAAPDQSLETPVRLGRARDHHDARGVAVEAVHDPRPLRLVAARDRVAEQAVDERPRRVAGGRMHDEAGRLVHDEEVLVLVHDSELHRLRFELALRLLRRLELDPLAAGEAVALRARHAGDEHAARFE